MSKAANAVGAFIGFDAGSYPGDALMQDWWSNSPYQFAGYYLNAPCHRNFTPWEGNRSNLIGMGWTLLLIYVGQQRPPQPGQNGCDQNNLTNTQGVADAIDAAQHATNDGFTAGTYIYLDIETGDPFDADLSAYLSGWVPQIVNSGFGIGVYCSRNIAADVNNFIATILPSNTAPPRFWVFGDSAPPNEKFNRDVSSPSDSKVSFAAAWQSLTHQQTWGSNSLSVDESVSSLSDPSSPTPSVLPLSIPVFTEISTQPAETGGIGLPASAAVRPSTATIDSQVLSDKLQRFLTSMDQVISRSAASLSSFDVREETINLIVSADGSIELVGKASGGSKASMSMVLRRTS